MTHHANRPHLPKAVYQRELLRLQAELATMTDWVQQTGARVVVLFEGRDAAGKGGVIKRITENLSPRVWKLDPLDPIDPKARGRWEIYARAKGTMFVHGACAAAVAMTV